MRSSWRRSAIPALVLTVAVLLLVAGVASATVTQVQITAPTAANPVYAKSGGLITITADITAGAGESIYMNGAVGSNTTAFSHVGIGDGAAQSFTVQITLDGSEPEGWKNVSVQAYVPGTSTMADTQIDAVCVDNTPPTAPGAFTEPNPATSNDATPTWSWVVSTDPVSGVKHYDVQVAFSNDGITWGAWAAADPATADLAASWTATGLTAPGFYKIQVKAVDNAGNESSYSESGVYKFDNVAPTPPGAATVTPASPGTLQPKWEWTASSEDPAEPWQSGVRCYHLEIFKDGVKALDYPEYGDTQGQAFGFEDGLWTIRISAVDYAGNESASVDGAPYLLDTTAPSDVAATTCPASPSNVTQPTWSWPAADDGAGSGVHHYVLQVSTNDGSTYDEGNPIAVSPTTPTVSWAPAAALSPDAKYRIRVKAVDGVGLESANWYVSDQYWLDTVSPGNAGTITVQTTPSTVKRPTWTWIAADDLGGTPIDHYRVEISSDNGSNWAAADPSEVAGEAWTPAADLSDGKYLIRVMAFDQAGNYSAGWSTAPSEYHLDTTPPSEPSGFVDPAPNPGTNDTPTWTWVASADAPGGVGLHATAPYEAEVSTDGGNTWTAANPTSVILPSWTPAAALVDGSYTIRVRSVDALNNKSAWGVSGAYVFDKTPPTAPSNITVTPASPSNQQPTWSWTPSTDTGGSGLMRYEIQFSNDDFMTYSTVSSLNPPNPPDPSITYISLADGEWKIRVSAVDNAGNMSAFVGAPTAYLLDTVAPDAPSSFTDPTPTPGNDTTPTWSWIAPADSGAGLHETTPYEVQISLNSGPWADASPATALSASWTADPELSADGKYKVQVRAVDKAGNKSAYGESGEYWLDATLPVVDDATWSGPWTGQPGNWINSANVTISVTAYDPGADAVPPTGSGLKLDSAWYELDGAAPIAVTADPTGNISVSLLGLPDGEHILTIGIEDNAGNQALPKSIVFHLDTAGPTFSNPFPADGYETNNTAIAPHIDIADVGSGVNPESIAWDLAGGMPGATAWVDPTSTFTPNVPLSPDGVYSMDVYASDIAGNGSISPTWGFLLDTAAPEVSNVALNVQRIIGTVPYTPNSTPSINVTVIDVLPEPSGFNGGNSLNDGTFDVAVFSDAAMTMPVDGTLTREVRPTFNSDPWPGSWIPAVPMADGDYFVKVIVTDDAGNTAEYSDFMFVVDTVAPSVAGNAEVGFLNNNNDRRFTNSRMITATWDASVDPDCPDEAPGSGLLGYTFEIWTKAESDASPTGTQLYDDWDEWDDFNGHGLFVMYPSGSSTEVYTTSWSLPFESGKSYGVWLKAWDMLHNDSDWFDPPFIFDPDVPTDPGAPEVVGLKDPLADRRIADNKPTLNWAHSTDLKSIAQSGVDLYEVQITRAGTTTWDVLSTVVDIDPDEDVDKIDIDAPLTGDFTWTVPTALADGSYEVRVRAMDVAGNYTNWVMIPAAFEIDTTPPAIPGIPTTASPTNNPDPVWAWGAVEGAVQYHVFEDEVDKGFVTEPTYTSADLAEGTHNLQVTALDDLGNESARSATGHVVIDLTAPAVPEMLPLAPFTNADAVTLIWATAGDAVKYDVEYAIAGTVTTVNDIAVQTLTVDISSAVDGDVVSANVRAYDAVGNVSPWSTLVLTTVDRTAPTVSFALTPPSPTNNPRPGWAWQGQDDISPVDHYVVALDNEAAFQTHELFYQPASNLPDGIHRMSVKAVDRAGNESILWTWSEVEIDTTPPAIPGMPTTASPTNNPDPVWTWGAVAGAVQYHVFEDEVDKGFVTEPTYTSADLAEGTHYLQVTALDALNNESAKSEAGYVVIDLTPPAVPTMKAMPTFTNAGSLTFEWSTSPDAVKYDLSYSKNGGVDWIVVPNLTAQSYTVSIADVPDGTGVLGMVRAYDGVGNVSEYSDAEQVIIDRTGPVVTITNPTAALTTNAATFTYAWTAVDAGAGVKSFKVRFNGAEYTTNSPAWTGTLVAGANTFEVWGIDALGNEGSAVAAPVVTQVLPQIALVQPVPGGSYKINEISTIAFKVVGLYDGPIRVRVNGVLLDGWRIVELANTPGLSKFYILLDAEVMAPGPMGIAIEVGATKDTFIYDVDAERSGFGFGRLRPW